ncbi:LexA family protein [Deinococcus budaensis]|uniref:Repressor LexA n=1 Tax=Deinococcus budaensis TaxID=1665626 RepID=A0A7W8GCE4_9DEIO|nr:S24 family peptidase [Deinococcus budaensis]MBB5232965.1 repressor LexA [Deinococcus budaensis]
MVKNKSPDLTPRQHTVLEKVWQLEHAGENVTLARLAEGLGIARQNVHTHVLALRDLGLVRYEAQARQTAVIRLTEPGYRRLGKVAPNTPNPPLSLPIVGHVAAGQPGVADQHIEGYATKLGDLLDLHEGDFLLRVRGESMLGIGIYPDDYVVIHPTQEEPLNGEIALVAVPGEDTATLKRWRRDNGTVTLLSENPDFVAMTFRAEDVLVQGCLVGHIGTGRARQTRFTTL